MSRILKWPFLVIMLFLGVLAGCTPAGPRALLDGKELLDEGRPADAVKRFETAVSLLPTNAQAFNYLGLAYHMAGQITNAQKAYHRAVQLNPDLSEARYNLGSLYLELNRLDAAKGEFTAYTLRLPKAPEGWIKLGAAQHRVRDYANAERSFNEALRLSPGNVEALNGLGMVRLQRGRVAEARQSFEAALQQEPAYSAAMLNLAVLYHQSKDTAKALALYKRYSGLKPSPPRGEEVSRIIQQLERELTPVAPVSPVASIESAPVTNAPAPAATISRASVTSAPVSSPQNPLPNPPAQRTVTASLPATNSVRVSPPGTPVLRTSTGTVRVASSPGSTAASTVRGNGAEVAAAPGRTLTVKPAAPNPEPPPAAETVVLSDEPQVKPARDQANVAPRVASAPPTSSTVSPRTSPRQAEVAQTEQKRGFLRKLNPMNLLPDRKKEQTPVYGGTPVASRSPGASQALGSAQSGTSLPVRTPEPQASASPAQTPATFPRYTYRSPRAPVAGDRAAAERAFADATLALKSQRPSEAAQSLRAAAQLDPSYFEAHYNLGVVLSQAGEAAGALAAYENALAARPQSADARYNFALLLKQAGYLHDAANELEILLKGSPSEARGHLALGNMYAEQLKQPARAREHYQKYLEIDPRSPQAATVRYWLARTQN